MDLWPWHVYSWECDNMSWPQNYLVDIMTSLSRGLELLQWLNKIVYSFSRGDNFLCWGNNIIVSWPGFNVYKPACKNGWFNILFRIKNKKVRNLEITILFMTTSLYCAWYHLDSIRITLLWTCKNIKNMGYTWGNTTISEHVVFSFWIYGNEMKHH